MRKSYEVVPAHIVELMQKALNAMIACETRVLLKPTAGTELSHILVCRGSVSVVEIVWLAWRR